MIWRLKNIMIKFRKYYALFYVVNYLDTILNISKVLIVASKKTVKYVLIVTDKQTMNKRIFTIFVRDHVSHLFQRCNCFPSWKYTLEDGIQLTKIHSCIKAILVQRELFGKTFFYILINFFYDHYIPFWLKQSSFVVIYSCFASVKSSDNWHNTAQFQNKRLNIQWRYQRNNSKKMLCNYLHSVFYL